MTQLQQDLPLSGLRVIDVGTVAAAPLAGTVFGDFGADVIKVDHPQLREETLARLKQPRPPLGGKHIQRNKRSITLDLGHPKGQVLLKRLAARADILIENFRPGVMERWGLGPEELEKVNPRLIMVRISGFGQTGPYRYRTFRGTGAEAMSGFAHIMGQPDGPPTLPPFAMADTIAAIFSVFGAMFAVYHRDVRKSGKGQVVDTSLYEPIFWILGDQSLMYAKYGTVQNRVGNRSVHDAPRNAYQTREGHWVALSGGGNLVPRVLRIVGGENAVNDPRFKDNPSRMKHIDELDNLVGGWIKQHTLKEVLDAFERYEAPIAPVYNIAQIFEDPQFQAREDIIEVQDPDLGPLKMQGVFPKLSKTPGRVRHTGRTPGTHNREIYLGELGMSEQELLQLEKEGVI